MRTSVSIRKRFTSSRHRWIRHSLLEACQQSLCAREMRAVVHLAVYADRACRRLRGECRDHGLGLLDLCRSGCEYVIDDRHLGRVDGQTSGETIAASSFGIAAQTL